MTSSDPMADAPGRVLLNGNAETTERFVALAHRTLGESQHRHPGVRAAGRVLICTGAWGPGEANDGSLRARFRDLGRHELDNLGIHGAVMSYLEARPLVKALYEEHEAVWWELFHAYSAENGATVARLRDTWQRVAEQLPDLDPLPLLYQGDQRPPGPRTRPARIFLQTAYARQIQRAVRSLRDADARHAATLRGLWGHFHVAAGCAFDPLWQEIRARLAQSILDAAAIVLPGGSPSRLLVGFRFFRIDDVLTEALRRGTNVFGSSAGAMALGRRLVIFNDRAVPRQEFQLLENGVRVVEGLQILPHCTDRVQTDDPVNLAYLAARFSDRAIVGLNQGSVLELSPEGGRWRAWSVGDEDVVVFGRDGHKHRFAPGEPLPLEGLISSGS